MKQFFHELFEYNHHYNQKLWLLLAENADKTPGSTIRLYNHILNAHHIWNNRIDSVEPLYDVWQDRPIEEGKAIDENNYNRTLRIIGEFDFNTTIAYKTSRGQPYQHLVRELLFHVINHSTYHRGQIAMELRKNDIEPLVTDYIVYKR